MPDRSYAPVRWQQTAGFGIAPNPAMPNTFMASAVDIGQRDSPAKGPHVQNKQDIGRRLVLSYQKEFMLDKDIFAPGPLARSAMLKGGNLTITFRSLSPRGFRSPLPSRIGFELSSGADIWVDVSGVELGDNATSVVIAVPDGLNPVFVRYLWAMNPCLPEHGKECPLHDADGNGLPALPFVLNVSGVPSPPAPPAPPPTPAPTPPPSKAACPAEYPWAYRPARNFDYCCSSEDDKFGHVGINALENRSARGESCKNDAFSRCTSSPCSDYTESIILT